MPAIFAYLIANEEQKRKIRMDVEMYWTHTKGSLTGKTHFVMWYNLILLNKEFRNVFYCRFPKLRHILPFFLHPVSTLFINPVLCKNYDGGLYISHGTSSQVYANKIGKNLWMHHNVTLGMIGEGRPEIGDNVYIGTGAVVLGGIKIGNNVRIGANAIVIDDVPDNAVVVSPKAKVVRIKESGNREPGGGKSLADRLL